MLARANLSALSLISALSRPTGCRRCVSKDRQESTAEECVEPGCVVVNLAHVAHPHRRALASSLQQLGNRQCFRPWWHGPADPAQPEWSPRHLGSGGAIGPWREAKGTSRGNFCQR